MKVLGIETSSEVCSVGLVEGNRAFERSLIESRIHSEKLLTLVKEVCGKGGVDLQRLDAIAVSKGPGSFTGLRIGMSTAKGLSYALGKPIIAVSTFQAIADGVFHENPEQSTIMICVDAKQGDFYTGHFQCGIDGARELGEVGIQSLQEIQRSGEPLTVTDRVEDLKRVLGEGALVKPVRAYCRGDAVARRGMRMLQSGRRSDLSSLEPQYLKDFVVRSA